MIGPPTRELALLSVATSIIIVLVVAWWFDHQRLNLENRTLELRLIAAEDRIRALELSRRDR